MNTTFYVLISITLCLVVLILILYKLHRVQATLETFLKEHLSGQANVEKLLLRTTSELLRALKRDRGDTSESDDPSN